MISFEEQFIAITRLVIQQVDRFFLCFSFFQVTELNNFLVDKKPQFKTSKYHAYYVDWKDRCCSYDSNKNPKKYSHIKKIFINQDEMQKANYLSIVELKRSFFLGFHGLLDPRGNFEDTIYYPQDHPYTPIDWFNPKRCGGGVKMTRWSGDRLPFLTESCYGHKNS